MTEESENSVVDAVAREMVSELRIDFHGLREDTKKDLAEMRKESSDSFNKMFLKFDDLNKSNIQSLSGKSGAIVGSVIGILAVTFSFVQLVVSPIREGATQAQADIKELRVQQDSHLASHIQTAVETGKLLNAAETARSESLRSQSMADKVDTYLRSGSSTIDKMQGELQMLKDEVRDIDQHGTHIKSP